MSVPCLLRTKREAKAHSAVRPGIAASEADLGMVEEARDHLGRAFSINSHLTVRDLPAARDLAVRLGLAVPGPS